MYIDKSQKKKVHFEQFYNAFYEACTQFSTMNLTDYDNWLGHREMCKAAWKMLDKRTKIQKTIHDFREKRKKRDDKMKDDATECGVVYENKRIKALPVWDRITNNF